jgi:hypothetical protein
LSTFFFFFFVLSLFFLPPFPRHLPLYCPMALSAGMRGQIVGMSKAGSKSPAIAAELNVSERTVRSVLQQFKNRGDVEIKKSPGRPRKLSERDVRSVVTYLHKNRRATLADITNSLPTKVSQSTVRRTLHSLRIFSCAAVIKPFLTLEHKAARLAFAKKYKDWTAEDWKKVVWTDESSFEVGKNCRKVRVWRTEDEKYESSCVVPSFKSGRSSVMVWGAFVGSSMSNLVVIPAGERKAVNFIEIVYKGELLGFLAETSNAFLMEDGAPIHRAKVSKEWREKNGIQSIKWPAQSPDLNPIENVWFLMKSAVHNKNIRPRTVKDMLIDLIEEWQAISKDYLKKLIDSMPERIKAVIANKGGSTRW